MTIDCLQILIFLTSKEKSSDFQEYFKSRSNNYYNKMSEWDFPCSKQDFWVQDEVHLKSRLMSFPSAG